VVSRTQLEPSSAKIVGRRFNNSLKELNALNVEPSIRLEQSSA